MQFGGPAENLWLRTGHPGPGTLRVPDNLIPSSVLRTPRAERQSWQRRGPKVRPVVRLSTRTYIDGSWCDAQDGKTLAVINPADESARLRWLMAHGPRPIEPSPRPSPSFPAWRALSVYDRAKMLKQTAELMRGVPTGSPVPSPRSRASHSSRPDSRSFTRPTPSSGSRRKASAPRWPGSTSINVTKRHYAIKYPGGRGGYDHPMELSGA